MATKKTVLSSQFDHAQDPEPAKAPRLTEYIRNPFYISITGIEWIFTRAKGVAILLLIISIISNFPRVTMPQPNSGELTPEEQQFLNMLAGFTLEQWLMIGAGVFIALIILALLATLLRGISDYTSAQLALGKKATLGEATKATLHDFWPYIWVLAVMSFKILLWGLLFIVPGIVMAMRYSLAGVTFFAEDRRKANDAIGRSLELTKDTVLTLFASRILLNVATLGMLSGVLEAGNNSVLYAQLRDLRAKGEATPPAHWLSTVTVIFYIALIIFGIAALTVLGSV